MAKPSFGRVTRSYTARKLAKRQRQRERRQQMLQEFDQVCLAQRHRIKALLQSMSKRISERQVNDPSPLAIDHDVTVRGRF